MFDVCLATARSVITNCEAMAAFERPWATSSITSRSRGVRPPIGWSCERRDRSWEMTCGSIAVPPAATRRTASMNRSASKTRSFSR
ncbi:hypothetical protein EES46_21940 [Streptomyces sp. ADI98-10]|nr:hypothetical protein EES46_21940 [Streptomyces sp. ADI98-10]